MNKRAVYEANKAVLPLAVIFGATGLVGAICWYVGQWFNVAPQVVFGWFLVVVGIPSVLVAVWIITYRKTVEHDRMNTDTWR